MGTAISNLAIYPLDLIITRLQVQRSLRSEGKVHDAEYKGVLDAFEKIYNDEGGVRAFYTGVLQDTGKSIVDSFLFFLFYNYLRTRRLQKNGSKFTTLPALEELLVGAGAGACSKFFTTPISNIVTRKQTASLLSARSTSKTKHAEPTVADIYSTILSEKGIAGFWSGYSASLVLTLNPSLTFFLYEFFKRTTLPRSQREHPGARVTFLMAAVAKACASTVTYPFSLAKARAQASSRPPVDKSTTDDLKSDAKDATDSDRSGAEKEQIARSAASKAKAAAKKNNVFAEILKIYREDGVEALYEGVYGEILKGFFSHGITMLVKESIHKLIIKAYFAILQALNKLPNPKEVVKDAEEKVKSGVEGVKNMATHSVEKGKEAVSSAVEQGQSTLQSGYSKAGELAQSGKETLNAVSERASNIGSNAATVGSNVAEGAKDAASTGVESAKSKLNDAAEKSSSSSSSSDKTVTEKVKDVAAAGTQVAKEKVANAVDNSSSSASKNSTGGNGKSATSEATQKAGKVVGAEELRSQEAGYLLGNAQEMLGDKLVEAGKGLKGQSGSGEKK